ncbi:hypothetical protein CGZ80_18555 [Rhodopirellula sp. MGV]|nr:hypothetical protein CGZ80_18555 [Rhodopirellula sp. MGV]PNY37956.1 hypothetical protein C2E31_05505 [Rhodopirellula baltica]
MGLQKMGLDVVTVSDQQAWELLPEPVSRVSQALPLWARMLATDLPKSTAALLQLDFAQRTASPVDPVLRAAMRWTAADANQCHYAKTVAENDALEAGISPQTLEELRSGDLTGWAVGDRSAISFARQMSLDSAGTSDAQFGELVRYFGERQAASMVLLMAYANFQDRMLRCLGIADRVEPAPLKPVEVRFDSESLQVHSPTSLDGASDVDDRGLEVEPVEVGADWLGVGYEVLQDRLQQQRERPTRLPIPDWETCASQLPEGLMPRPSEIVWYRIVFGYAPELAVPFEIYMRTSGAETRPHYDRILGGSLFWIVTRSVNCPYCMGHCEMNWEVAGMDSGQIAEHSRRLAEDWSSFSPQYQHAFAFGRKLSDTPWLVDKSDTKELRRQFGHKLALAICMQTSRYHYMVRISNGFQLTLENENVFYDYWNQVRPSARSADDLTVELPSDEEAWRLLPEAISGAGQPLPNWAKAVATQLPRTAAAMLSLDAVHRLNSPIDATLLAKQRWVIANANRCDYSKAVALSDLRAAGASEQAVEILVGDPLCWPESDQRPLEFARLLTLAAPTIPDSLFSELRAEYGDQQVAAMVLLAAYGNFQDRILHGLNCPVEETGPLPPLEIEFVPGALRQSAIMPEENGNDDYDPDGVPVVTVDEAWGAVSYDELQRRLDEQRSRTARLPIPSWEEVKAKLPAEMQANPTRIVWSLVNYGYAPELAIAWTTTTRTHWDECPGERILEESLFWVQTRAVECNYCMGHCEMLLDVAGLDQDSIAKRTRLLSGTDWSMFPPSQQRAFAFAKKLTSAPWEITAADYRELEDDYGPKQWMSLFWWLCRGLYMTRISDGFQLPLESQNVFQV